MRRVDANDFIKNEWSVLSGRVSGCRGQRVWSMRIRGQAENPGRELLRVSHDWLRWALKQPDAEVWVLQSTR